MYVCISVHIFLQRAGESIWFQVPFTVMNVCISIYVCVIMYVYVYVHISLAGEFL
jgi:hypothetical protein